MWRRGRTQCAALSALWRAPRQMHTGSLKWVICVIGERKTWSYILILPLQTYEAGHVYDLRGAESLTLGISASCQQAIVLEGSYWKRRIEVVIKEYHKWRIYYKKRVSTHTHFICCIYFFLISNSNSTTFLFFSFAASEKEGWYFINATRGMTKRFQSCVSYSIVCLFRFLETHRCRQTLILILEGWIWLSRASVCVCVGDLLALFTFECSWSWTYDHQSPPSSYF